MMNPLIHKVSLFALNKIKMELLATDNVQRFGGCHCSIKVHYGIPCRHVIVGMDVIPLSAVHRRWHLFPEENLEEEGNAVSRI